MHDPTVIGGLAVAPTACAPARQPCRGRRRCPAVLVMTLAIAGPLHGQGAPNPAHDAGASGAAVVETGVCAGGRISSIWIDNHSVFDLTDPGRPQRLDWAFRLANRLHIRTREDVIRRELVFDEGDCYEPELLRESERVLRATGFIAEVDVYGIEQEDGSYHVIVDTRDEWSTRVELQSGAGTGLQVTGVAVREDNLLGTGRQAAAFYLQDRDERVYGISYLDPQLFATRWQAGFAMGRTPLGGLFRESVEYPFLGETGRRAFRQRFEHHDRYFNYLANSEDGLVEVVLPERRRSFDLGGAIRFGERGNLTLLGAMLVGQWVSYPGDPRPRDPARTPADSLIDGRMVRHDSVADVRAMLLVGQRNVRFVRRRALDTVHGVEDVRLGMELELGVGRSIGGLSSGHATSLEFGMFAAIQPAAELFAGTRFVVQGRRNYEAPATDSEWEDVFAQLDGWAYWRPRPRSPHLLVATLAASGGWHPRVPFQLTLGGASGLRGHPLHIAAGGRRAVLSLETRSYWGWPQPELFDLGSVVFVDMGRIWAGGVPYGTTTGVHANLGAGLRAAFPPGSHNTFRLDVAAPVRGGLSFSDVVVSIGVRQAVGRAPRYDLEMFRSSRRGPTTSTFRVRTDRDP